MIQRPVEHNVRLIAVPEEKLSASLPGVAASEIETLTDDTGQVFDILDYFDATKGEPWPTGLITLAVGVPLTEGDIFKVYQKSDKVYLFIAKPRRD